MGEYPYEDEVTNGTGDGSIGNVKNISDAIKKVSNSVEENVGTSYSDFRVAKTNTRLPEKTSFWTKVKNALFCEIQIELTPYQQKVEDEINDFLHQDITLQSLKEAALSEVPITFMGKRIF